MISARGHRVAATDITPTLVAAAQSVGSAAQYCVADATFDRYTRVMERRRELNLSRCEMNRDGCTWWESGKS